MSQFCYLTHWRMTKSPPNEGAKALKSKAVRKFLCFLTTKRGI